MVVCINKNLPSLTPPQVVAGLVENSAWLRPETILKVGISEIKFEAQHKPSLELRLLGIAELT